MNYEKRYELVKYEDGDLSLEVKVSLDDNTVWLTQNDMSILFDLDRTRITRHVNNILIEGELSSSVCAENAQTAADGKIYKTKIYNLEMIVAVGHKVKSKRTELFAN